MPRRIVLGPLLAAVLITAGCSGGGHAPAPPPAAAAEPVSAAPSAPASAAPTQSAAACLTGTYRLVRFVGVGASQAYGTGQGGDVQATFRGHGFTLAGGGRKPILVTLAGQSADLTVDGTAKGRFTASGAMTTFTTTSTTGSATLQAGHQKQNLSMREVVAVVGLNGSARVACTAQAMTVTLKTVRLEFGRV